MVVMLGVLLAERARGSDVFVGDWSKQRQAQPAVVTLELKLPKTSFTQGELIPATLIFANTSSNSYHLWTGNYNRSGRVQDIGFRGESALGQSVPDPLAWYFKSFLGMGGGLGSYKALGSWSITLAANQWLRFDEPGTYQIYAWSSRPQPGTADYARPSPPGPQVVSQIVSIEITPLEPARERQMLSEALAALDRPSDEGQRARDILRYLQTPDARSALRALLAKEEASDA
jgi:hypothetical protein